MLRLLALACVASLLLLAGAPAAQIAKWPEGRRMQVTFSGGEKSIGRLGPVGAEGFTLLPDHKGSGTARQVRFTEVQSVKTKWTTGEKWVIGGAIYAGITIFFAALL